MCIHDTPDLNAAAEDTLFTFEEQTTTTMLHALKDLPKAAYLPPATTYSFRNLYMEKIFLFCEHDWKGIVEYTGHLEIGTTVKAYYDRI